jgi:hypothetical protein
MLGSEMTARLMSQSTKSAAGPSPRPNRANVQQEDTIQVSQRVPSSSAPRSAPRSAPAPRPNRANVQPEDTIQVAQRVLSSSAPSSAPKPASTKDDVLRSAVAIPTVKKIIEHLPAPENPSASSEGPEFLFKIDPDIFEELLDSEQLPENDDILKLPVAPKRLQDFIESSTTRRHVLSDGTFSTVFTTAVSLKKYVSLMCIMHKCITVLTEM